MNWSPASGSLVKSDTWSDFGYQQARALNEQSTTGVIRNYPLASEALTGVTAMSPADSVNDNAVSAVLARDMAAIKAAGFDVVAIDTPPIPSADANSFPGLCGLDGVEYLGNAAAAEGLSSLILSDKKKVSDYPTSEYPAGRYLTQAEWTELYQDYVEFGTDAVNDWYYLEDGRPVIMQFAATDGAMALDAAGVDQLTGAAALAAWGQVGAATNGKYYLDFRSGEAASIPAGEQFGGFAFTPAVSQAITNRFAASAGAADRDVVWTVSPGYYNAGVGANGAFAPPDFTRLHAGYQAAIAAAAQGETDKLLFITWNDLLEDTDIQPSANKGEAMTRLTAFYNEWFKTGVQPQLDEPLVVIATPLRHPEQVKTAGSVTDSAASGEYADFGALHYWVFSPQATTLRLNGDVIAAVPGGQIVTGSYQLDATTQGQVSLDSLSESLSFAVAASGAEQQRSGGGGLEYGYQVLEQPTDPVDGSLTCSSSGGDDGSLTVQAKDSESAQTWSCELPAGTSAITLGATVKSSLSWAEGSLDVRFYDSSGTELSVAGPSGERAGKYTALMAQVGGVYRYRLGSWFGTFEGLEFEQSLLVPDGAGEVRLSATAASRADTPRTGALTLSSLSVVPGVVLDPVTDSFGSDAYKFEQTLFRTSDQLRWDFEPVPAVAGKLDFKVKGLDGAVVAAQSVTVRASASSPGRIELAPLAQGYYTIEARFTGSAGRLGVWNSAFVVLPDGSVAPDQRFGVDAQLSWRTSPAEVSRRSAAMLAELGVGSARDRINWSELTPDCTAAWSQPGGGRAKLVAAELLGIGGIETVQMFESSPACARVGSTGNKDAPTDYDAAYNFGRAYAQWAADAKVDTVEVWNEANASSFFRGYPYQYASLLKAFADGAKSVEVPGATPLRILIASSADYPGKFMEEVYANNAAPYFDVRNLHFYRGNAFRNSAPVDLEDFLAADPAEMVNSLPDMSGSINDVEAAAGVAAKPGWLTETGYALNRDAAGSFAAAELVQADYLVKSYAQGFAAGYERVFEFAWQEVNEPNHGSFGIVRSDLTPRPATLALGLLTQHLAGAEPAATVRHGSAGRTVYFERADGSYVAVTWGGGGSLPASATVTDVFGRPATATQATADGAATYLVSGITALPADARAVVVPHADPADSVPDLRLEVAKVTVGDAEPPLPAAGSTLNAEVTVPAGQELAVAVRARDGLTDVSGQTAVTCLGADGLTLVSGASPTASGGLFTCRYLVSLEAGKTSHATVTASANGVQDTVRVALRGAPPAGSFVPVGYSFQPGERVVSPDGETVFTWLETGELELGGPVWKTWLADTRGATRLRLQSDGNLVAYAADGRALWASSSGDPAVAWLAVLDDGALALQSADGQDRWRVDLESVGPPAPALDLALSWFTVSDGDVVADGAGSGTVTVSLAGSDGQPWTGQVPALVGAGAAGSGLLVGPFTQAAGSPGVHTAPFTGTVAGDWPVSVTADGQALTAAGNQTAHLVAPPVEAELRGPAGSAEVGGELTVSVFVADARTGAPLAGQAVLFHVPAGVSAGLVPGPADVP
ncbi:MAG: hypothetical protein LBU05_05070, partial [Bifidobacteriaceae bacterium]|nr:hypothetical protein [Bifidobacteriaceae bacterium]